MMRLLKSKKGFTLIELLIVMAIIAILIGISLPRFRGMQDEGQKAKVRGNLATLRTAVEAYSAAPRRNGATKYPDASVQNPQATWTGNRVAGNAANWQRSRLMVASPAAPAAQTVGTAGPVMLTTELVDPFSATGAIYGYHVNVDAATGNVCYVIWSDGTRGAVTAPTVAWAAGVATVTPGTSIFVSNGNPQSN